MMALCFMFTDTLLKGGGVNIDASCTPVSVC